MQLIVSWGSSVLNMLCVYECVCEYVCCEQEKENGKLRQLCGRGGFKEADIQLLVEESVEVIQKSDSWKLIFH